ncbi:nickel ABC transporter permease [Lysinibacillus sp. KU-BSD001]|uniref:nickel ABC transporter permease n=1 Tax=Lysinibacillus sp. KU-BSD001 TaxID=3141328 RepID=UPI0036E5918A
MGQFLTKRLLSMVLALWGITIIAFFLVRVMPVDPIEAYFQANQLPVTEEAMEQVREEHGLNQPMFTQYVQWLSGAIQFNFGTSFMTNNAVSEELFSRFSVTMQLAVVAFLFILLLCVPIGIISAVKRDSWFDRMTRLTIFSIASMPSFWLAFVLVYTVALKLDLLPLMGWGTVDTMILPALTLALGVVPYYVRMIRTSMIEQMDQPFVTFARARGVPEHIIIRRHIFKGTLTPLITSLAMTIGVLLGGAAIVEIVFTIPGMGRFIVEAIIARDYYVLQAFIFIIGFFYIVINFMADLVCAWIDPRIRIKEDAS